MDKFKAKESADLLGRKTRITEKLEMDSHKANIGTNGIITKMFKRGGMMSLIGDLLLAGLPKLFNLVKNLKSKVLALGKELFDYFLKNFKLPNIPNLGKGSVPNINNAAGNIRPSASPIGGTPIIPSNGGSSMYLGRPNINKNAPRLAGEVAETAERRAIPRLAGEVAEETGKVAAKTGILGKVGNVISKIPKIGKLGKIITGAGALGVGAEAAAHASESSATNLIDLTLQRAEGNVAGNTGSVSKIGNSISKAIAPVKAVGSEIVEKVLNSSAVKKLAGSSIGEVLGKLGKFIVPKLAGAGAGIFAKIGAKWAAIIGTGAASGGIVPAIWYGGTIINGISATNRMFNISPNSKPTMLMRTIAGFSSFISDALTFGIVSPDTIAQFIGGFLLTDKDTEEMHKGQDLLQKERDKYAQESGDDISLSDYNEKVNKSLATKTWDGMKYAGNKVVDVVKNDTVFSAFNDDKIRSVMGYGDDKEIGVQDRISMGTGSMIQTMALGLVKQSGAVKVINDAINNVKQGWQNVKTAAMKVTPLAAFDDDRIRELLGLDANVPVTMQDRISVGTGSVLSNLSFGLIKQSNATGAINGAIEKVKSGWDALGNGVSWLGDQIQLGLNKLDVAAGSMFGLKDDDGNPMGLTTWVSGGVTKAYDEIGTAANNALNGIKGFWGSIDDRISKFKEGIGEALDSMDNSVGEFLHLKDEEGNGISLSKFIAGVGKSIKNGYNSAREYVSTGFNNNTSSLQSASSSAISARNAAANDSSNEGNSGLSLLINLKRMLVVKLLIL